ncbi:MAG TPA: crotonase/enoyl-CoA hydratase family protein [Acidimicrobiales bacterium]|nr:crotonase/enoyl-CoA hydratase family protein [Acidimicrobiales bacterium]
MTTASEVFTVEREGHVATLWLDRPAQRNAMGAAFWSDLPVLMRELGEEDDVRVIVLAAKGPHFTVGLDLKWAGLGGAGVGGAGDAGTGGEDGAAHTTTQAARSWRGYRNVRRMQASISSVADCPKPVIAAVQGYCLGGGIDLITACDIRLAAADAVFSVRETRIAIVADVGTLQRLPRIVPSGHAAELAFTGKDVSAERAHQIGLVNDVLPDADSVVKAAREMASEIAANSPLTVQGVKAVLSACADRTVEEGLDYVAAWNMAYLQSDDLKEALTAFVEKRPPVFRGE